MIVRRSEVIERVNTENHRARRERWVAALIVIAACTAAALPLWMGPGVVNTRAGGDSPFLLVRTFELAENLRAGVFPARWMPNAAYGFGYPFFYFYAALPYYLAATMVVLGADLLFAIKLTQTLGFLLAAWAMFRLARRWLSRSGAVLAACAYTFMPFHLVNVYVRGDALSEFWAFVWFPLIADRIAGVVMQERGAAWWLGGTLAALALTHNVSTLLFAPIAALWALGLLATLSTWRLRLQRAAVLLGAGTLGLGLSAWFWLPALMLIPHAQLGDQTSGYFYFANHFRAADLVQPSLAFDYSLADGRRAFAMGLVPTLLVVSGAALGARGMARAGHATVWGLTSALFVISTFLITPLSAPIWETVRPLQWAQFPWRWLSVQSLFAALLIGGVGGAPRAVLRTEVVRSGTFVSVRSALVDAPTALWRRVAALAAILVLGWAALAQLPNARLNLRAEDVNAQSLQLYEWYSGNIGTTIRAEYLPAAVQPRPYTGFPLLSRPPQVVPLEAAPPEAVRSERLAHNPNVETWRVELAQAMQVALPIFVLPGARVQIDDAPPQPATMSPSGWVQVQLEAGAHVITVWRAPLPIEQWANGISAASAAFAAAWGAWLLLKLPRERRQRLAVRSLLSALVLAALAGAGLARTRAAPEPPPLQALDFEQRPFPHRGPVHFGEGVERYTLVGAAIAPSVLRAGEPFTLTLRWLNDRAPAGITVTQELPMGGAFLNVFRYARESRAADPWQSQHRVLAEALPGPFLLVVQAHNAAQRTLPAFTDDGEPLRAPLAGGTVAGMTLYVGQVRAPTVSGADDEAAQRNLNTPVLPLVALDWFMPSHHEACFRPTWRWATHLAPIGEAFQFSFRLYDASGQRLVQADAQPQGGLMPTWAWLPGMRVPDSYCAQADRRIALPSGEPYTLEVVQYRLATREELGRLSFRGESQDVGGLHVLLP